MLFIKIYLISNPDLTLFYAEMWDLAKFDTTPFFIGYCEKGYRDNSLTVIGSFSACDESRGKLNMACQGGFVKVGAAGVMGRQSNSLFQWRWEISRVEADYF